jgi:hypothetical protein
LRAIHHKTLLNSKKILAKNSSLGRQIPFMGILPPSIFAAIAASGKTMFASVLAVAAAVIGEPTGSP